MNINTKIKSLIKTIVFCPLVNDVKNNANHVCYDIVKSQYNDIKNRDGGFQLPEPWNGHIDNAEILFVGSNPSIDFKANTACNNNEKHEMYPTEEVVKKHKLMLSEYFKNRFDSFWYIDENHNPQQEIIKCFDRKRQPYWYAINTWTQWILYPDRQNIDENLLKDHACLTEMVHCKSTSSSGATSKCRNLCSAWFKQILDIFNENSKGQYIVFVGDNACNWYDRNYDKNGSLFTGKTVIKMPHPTPSHAERPDGKLCKEMIRMQIEEKEKYCKVHLRCIKQIAENVLSQK